MRFDKLTLKGQEALAAAQGQAERLEHAQVQPEHLLEALLSQEDGLVPPLLKKLGASPEGLRSELMKHLSAQPKVHGGQITLSPRLDLILREAQNIWDEVAESFCLT